MSLRDRTVICITKFKVGPQVGLGLGDGGIYYAMTEAGSKDRTPMLIVRSEEHTSELQSPA